MDIIAEIQERAEWYAKTYNKNSWTLRPGVEIYWNPEFRCPYCGGGFPTNRVWMVDAERYRLLECWYIEAPLTEGGPPRLRVVGNSGDEIRHPHADHNGSLCMGNNSTAHQLLFNGIAQGKHHKHTEAWLLNVGHECPQLPRQNCGMCKQDFIRIRGHYYGYSLLCSERCVELAASFFCYNCFAPLEENRDPRHENYCPGCFSAAAKSCGKCAQLTLPAKMVAIRLYHKVCQTCFEGAGSCGICGGMFPYRELKDHGGRCDGCRYVACTRCSDTIKKREVNELGECPSCQAMKQALQRQREQQERDAIVTIASPTSDQWGSPITYQMIENAFMQLESSATRLETESCDRLRESLWPVLEGSDIGSSGVSVETSPEPE